jgi:hypothetical protein
VETGKDGVYVLAGHGKEAARKKDTGFRWRRVASSSLDLAGTKVAVVGGTGGLGRGLARLLAGPSATRTRRSSD